MGGKRTSELIPLCHPLPLTDLAGRDHAGSRGRALRIRAEAATTGQTGVEMEAMTAASVAALTVYDMVKGVERGVEIRGVRLISKTGGKSGDWERHDRPPSTTDRSAGRADRIARPDRPQAAAAEAHDGGTRPIGGPRASPRATAPRPASAKTTRAPASGSASRGSGSPWSAPVVPDDQPTIEQALVEGADATRWSSPPAEPA